MSSGSLSSLPTERLEAELCTWAGRIAAATCRWLCLVAEYDRREAWAGWECTSMAQWLSVHVGVSAVTARQQVQVARRLDELPLIAAAFATGELSYSRVRALCRIATPATEQTLLELARHATASQLERIVADTVRAIRADQPGIEQRQVEARRVSWCWDDDGMLHVTQKLLPEVGAAFVRLVGESTQPGDEDVEQRRADAFAALLARVDVADPVAARRPLFVVHRYPDGVARLEGGPPLPRSVADTLDGDETTATHHPDGRITYSRRRRAPNRAMRRHVLARDRACAFPGCRRTDHLHTHHIAWYGRDGGDTVAANLIALCPKHHRAIHALGWTVDGNPETGRLVWRRPDGRVLDPAGLVPGGNPDAVVDAASGVGPDTIVPRSGGARYDHELTVWMLTNHPGFRPGPPPPTDAAAASRDAAASPDGASPPDHDGVADAGEQGGDGVDDSSESPDSPIGGHRPPGDGSGAAPSGDRASIDGRLPRGDDSAESFAAADLADAAAPARDLRACIVIGDDDELIVPWSWSDG